MIRNAADPDEYRAAIRPASAEVMVIGRGGFAARLTRIDLDRLWMQRGSESLPRIWHAGPSPGRSIIGFLTEAGPGAIRNGREFRYGDIALLSPRHAYRYRSLGRLRWAAMSLPTDEMAEVSAKLASRDLTPSSDEKILTPVPAAMTRLQRLHAAAGRLAEHAPEIISAPEAARGLEQALIEAMVDCLLTRDRREETAAHRRHTAIIQRFHATLEASDDQPVYLPELCRCMGVSGRTLRLCCQEQLGMSPKRYLLLRRMHLARRALHQAAGTQRTVTDIATEFGFWELGRFAVAYKALFGEVPSETLRHDPRQSHG